MHKLHVSREVEHGCYELTLDDKFVVASPSKQLIGEAIVDQLSRLVGGALISLSDSAPVLRQARIAQEQADAALAREANWRRPAFAQGQQPETD